MTDIVVSLREETDLELDTVNVGTTADGEVLAFTITGVIRGLEADLLEKFVGKSAVPTEIHFRIDGE